MMRRRGHTYDVATRAAMMGLPAAIGYGLLIDRKQLSDSPAILQQESDELFRDLLPARLKPMPWVSDALDRLDQLELPRCIATSSHPSFAQRALEIVGLARRFDFVLTAEDVTCGKPAPDIYLAVAERMQISVDELLVLEDSAVGVSSGVAAGAVVVAVPNEHTRGADYRGAVAVIDSLKPVVDAFDELIAARATRLG
jgi:pseudouridine 5'-phosphatase